MAKPSNTASIHYGDRDGKPAIPISGAWGGPAPDGSVVVMHVYSEWAMVPSIEQVPVTAEGRGDMKQVKTIKRGDVDRQIQATLVMSPEAAFNVGKWLVEKAAMAFEQRKSNPPPPIEMKAGE